MQLVQGDRYTKNDLYRLFAVPKAKQKGSWNTGYLKYNDEMFIFANIGVAGRTGHNYANKWKNGNLVWYGKTGSHIQQPLIASMLEPGATIHIFTREDDRDPFTYQGKATPKRIYPQAVPIKVVWEINAKQTPLVKNKVDEITLSKQIRQAKDDDINERINRSYRVRKGQPTFCKNLFQVCQGKCCITGCTIKAVLHACHIVPHAESGINNTTNGLLLRSDIHDLFDKHLIGIHPSTLEVHIKQELRGSEYRDLQGKTLLPRTDKGVNKDALKKRWHLFKKHH